MVDQVVPRAELHATLARILSLLREKQRAEPVSLPTAAGQ
jgi:acetyl-CoA carboxylase beta subunit